MWQQEALALVPGDLQTVDHIGHVVQYLDPDTSIANPLVQ
jgi:hypothetical protein